MKLPFNFPFGKKQDVEYFLALLLEDEAVTAVIFAASEGKISVSAQTKDRFPNLLDASSFEGVLDVVDKVVSKAEAELPNNAKLIKTIFAIKSDWTLEGKIKKDHVQTLKKICEELVLEPIGFLVFAEAILHLLQKEEGAPVSTILVELGKTHCTVSLVRAGRIVEIKQVKLEEPLPKSVDTALKQFQNLEILPARIILFDGEHNDHMAQSFIRYSWSKTLPFLHVPQITILPPRFETKSVLYGTATQMGLDVLEKDIPEVKSVERMFEESTAEENRELETEKIKSSDGNEHNFFDDANHLPVDENENSHEDELKQKNMTEDLVDADYFGFVKNKDVAKTVPKIQVANEIEQFPEEFIKEEIPEIPEMVKEQETHEYAVDVLPTENNLLFRSSFDGLKKIFRGISKSFFKKQIQKQISSRPIRLTQSNKDGSADKSQNLLKKVFFILSVMLLIFIGGIIIYVVFLKATVVIGITPQVINEVSQITLVSGGKTDTSSNILGTGVVNIDEEGTKSANATGSKDVGTPAKGQVTIFSRLTDTTILPKGTAIVALNGLQFTLDSDTQIASFSGGPDDPSVTVSNVSVTASDIGDAYNFPSGTKFNIAGQSKFDVSAKNDTAFSGGIKKSVTVVSQKDIDGLAQSLTKNLESKARNDLQKNLPENLLLLTGFTGEQISKKTIDKKVGDQAQSINFDGVINYQSQTYDKNDLMVLSKAILKDKVPQDANLSQNTIQTDISNISQKSDKTIIATLTIKASLLPNYNIKQIANDIAGKSFSQVIAIIKNLQQENNATIILHPTIPFLPEVLPRLPQNITITIENK